MRLQALPREEVKRSDGGKFVPALGCVAPFCGRIDLLPERQVVRRGEIEGGVPLLDSPAVRIVEIRGQQIVWRRKIVGLLEKQNDLGDGIIVLPERQVVRSAGTVVLLGRQGGLHGKNCRLARDQ
jgi:hypothetical protein